MDFDSRSRRARVIGLESSTSTGGISRIEFTMNTANSYSTVGSSVFLTFARYISNVSLWLRREALFPTEAWRRELSNCVVGPGCGYDVLSKLRNDRDLVSGVPDEERAFRYGDAERLRR